MAQEFQTTTFYDLTTSNLSYYSSMITFEKYIAANVFRGDVSRMLFTTTNFAFRARFEQMDRRIAYDGASTLNFPFASYWYDGYWSDDTRAGALQAGQMVKGITIGGITVRNRPVTGTFNTTFYFDSDKESRQAYDLLVWSFKPRSVILKTTVKYKGVDIVIPVVMSLDSISFNTEYTEKDWLTQNRILPFNAKFTIQSYVVGPYIQTTITDGITSTLSESPDIYIAEHIKLYFEAYRNMPSSDISADQLIQTVDAYFNPAYDISISSLTTSNLVWNGVQINYVVTIPESAASDSLSSITIKMKGKADIIIQNPALTGNTIITGLQEISTYSAYIYFYLKSGKIKTQTLSFTTSNNPATPDNTMDKPLKSLKGIVF
jgi:hypothetical protein